MNEALPSPILTLLLLYDTRPLFPKGVVPIPYGFPVPGSVLNVYVGLLCTLMINIYNVHGSQPQHTHIKHCSPFSYITQTL